MLDMPRHASLFRFSSAFAACCHAVIADATARYVVRAAVRMRLCRAMRDLWRESACTMLRALRRGAMFDVDAMPMR